MTNPFGSSDNATAVEVDETTDTTVAEGDLGEADVDVDVDAATEADEDAETVDAAPPTKGNVVKTNATTKKASTRPAVPEGFISPVAAAKELSKHLTAKAHEAGTIKEDEAIEIRPQVVYSYIKNNAAGSKNPITTYSEGGRDNLLKLDEFLAWWDAKDARVAERKANVKTKAAPAAPAAEVNEAEDAPTEPVAEAE